MRLSMVAVLSRSLLGISLLFGSLPSASAQRLSDRPITFVVPFTPGTGIDILARILADELRKRWNETVIVENRPGASGIIGTQFAARAEPDGHTMLVTVNSFVINAGYFKRLPYDPVKSFVPVTELAVGSFLLAVNAKTPFKTAAELIAYAKANPGKLNFSSPGLVTPHHVAMEMFKLATGVDIVHIPYGGTADAVRDLINGNIETMFIPIHVGLPLAQQGLIRALAVGSASRSELAPDVPTLAELGISGVEVDLWYALLAPAGTPAEIIERYNNTVSEILDDPRVKGLLAKQGLVGRRGTSGDLAKLIAFDLERWNKVLSSANLQER